jgi:hypothetical protein
MDDGTTVVQPRAGMAAVRLRKPVYLTRHWGVEVRAQCTASPGTGAWR